MKKKYWDYKQPIFIYILLGLGVMTGMTVFSLLFLVFRWKDVIWIFNEIVNLGPDFVAAIGGLWLFLVVIWILITGQLISILEIPTIGIFFISLEKEGIYGQIFIQYLTSLYPKRLALWEGIYGQIFIQYLTSLYPKRLALWEEIEKLHFKGRFFNSDGFATRTIFHLKNGKKFIVPNFGFGPAHEDFYSGNDYEKRFKYSNRAMYAIIMRKIGKEKFVNFPEKLLMDIEEASKNVNDFFESNREEAKEE